MNFEKESKSTIFCRVVRGSRGGRRYGTVVDIERKTKNQNSCFWVKGKGNGAGQGYKARRGMSGGVGAISLISDSLYYRPFTNCYKFSSMYSIHSNLVMACTRTA